MSQVPLAARDLGENMVLVPMDRISRDTDGYVSSREQERFESCAKRRCTVSLSQ